MLLLITCKKQDLLSNKTFQQGLFFLIHDFDRVRQFFVHNVISILTLLSNEQVAIFNKLVSGEFSFAATYS